MTPFVVRIGALAAAKLRLPLCYLIRLAPEALATADANTGRSGTIRRRDLCLVLISKPVTRQPFSAIREIQQRATLGAECFDPVPLTGGPVASRRDVLNQSDREPLAGCDLLPQPVVNREG